MSGATIWLVGAMGAGKSAVGARLAERLGLAFADADLEVERTAGARIPEIFAREGEAGFRARERRAIEALAGSAVVVALGGGAIAQPGAPERLAASGTVVWLRARPETLAARIGDAAGRPLLAGLDAHGRRARLRALLAERSPCYATATIAVDTDGLAPGAVAARIAALLQGRPEGAERMEGAATARTVRVELGARSYEIHLGFETLDQAGPAIAACTKARRAAIVTVPEVGRRYAPRLERSLREAGLRVRRLLVPDGERAKSFTWAQRLYGALLDFEADRGTVVVALGGGVVGDLAGFVAATWMRGVPFVQVPTTLLAMADASVGGKVAVDLPRGKNLVGAFHQPRVVWMDLATLRSLPLRQRAAGLAEMIKHGAIRDAALFERFERDVEGVLALEPAPTLDLLARSCAIKAEIVSQDEREAGLRMLLNFGHTLAHAVETLSGYRRILHGEAVALGMAFAARRSESLGHAPAGTADRLEALLERAGLPTRPPAFPRRAYLSALRVDKKRTDAHVRFVVLRGIGRADTVPLTPAEILPRDFGARAVGRGRAGSEQGPARRRRR
ncbi:MAG: 3-dehydroquinate synthase [Deltaproteobacteria bacterium]|nr:3-dehydroquinate synthase [Deltaproteobacteria bacterium]